MLLGQNTREIVSKFEFGPAFVIGGKLCFGVSVPNDVEAIYNSPLYHQDGAPLATKRIYPSKKTSREEIQPGLMLPKTRFEGIQKAP